MVMSLLDRAVASGQGESLAKTRVWRATQIDANSSRPGSPQVHNCIRDTRELAENLRRMVHFLQRDPLAFQSKRFRASGHYRDGMNSYGYLRGNPSVHSDATGLLDGDTSDPCENIGEVEDCTAAPPCSRFSGVCDADEGTPDERYRGFGARCVCICMTDSETNNKVRSCLACMEEKGIPPSQAHLECYDAADVGLGLGFKVCVQCGHCAETIRAQILAMCCFSLTW